MMPDIIPKLTRDSPMFNLVEKAYSCGWGDGYKAKGFENDWVDEGFAEFLTYYGVELED
jgi:ribonuclease HII